MTLHGRTIRAALAAFLDNTVYQKHIQYEYVRTPIAYPTTTKFYIFKRAS
jgi:hypothetical protein